MVLRKLFVEVKLYFNPVGTGGVDFWEQPEHAGWMEKQGEEVRKAYERRWFVMKRGKIFWFSDDRVTPSSKARGLIDTEHIESVKSAEDATGDPNSFEISLLGNKTRYFKCESWTAKEEWIRRIAKAIVKNSRIPSSRRGEV